MTAGGRTAFVLGGGGTLGAAEVGMLRALFELGIRPDLVVGTSIGAVNGAIISAEPNLDGVARLTELWHRIAGKSSFRTGASTRVRSILRLGGLATLDPGPIESLLSANLNYENIEDLPVGFQCVAASVERAAEHWFTSGPIVPAVMASAALPGIFPARAIDGEHYIDGGIVNSIPLDRVRKLGVVRAFVLQVGRIETPLSAPTRPWEVPIVAFEVARRARFHAALDRVSPSIEVHVLPTGGNAPKPTERSNFDPLDTSRVSERIDLAYESSREYLRERVLGLAADSAET